MKFITKEWLKSSFEFAKKVNREVICFLEKDDEKGRGND